MEKEEFINNCAKVRAFFDYSNDDEGDGSKAPPITRFIDGDDFYDRVRPKVAPEDEDEMYETIWNIRDMAFSIGFILGSEIEVTNLDTRAAIEAIRKEIKEQGLLPYLPRERRTP